MRKPLAGDCNTGEQRHWLQSTMLAAAHSESHSRDTLPVCLCPSPENPSRLVSLWDMLEVHAANFMWVGSVLRYLCSEMQAEGETDEMSSEYRESVVPRLREVAGRCELLDLPISKATTEHWVEDFRSTNPRKYIEGRCAIEEIERAIRNELGSTTLFFIPRERSAEFNRMLSEIRLLWEKPWDVALRNLDHARYCYRVDEFTASVFHSMRAAEKVLTTLACSLKIDPARDNWQTLIERIEAAVKDLDKLGRGHDREQKQTFYSEMAMQLRYIKNAWRNHVMHARSVYEEKDSREIWWHVKRTLEKASGELEEELET